MELYLKILNKDMRSCNGGKAQKWQLNKWYEIKGKIVKCQKGLHITLNPKLWNGSRVFIAETPQTFEEDFEKAVCAKLRLLKELSPEELEAYEKVEAQALEAYKQVEAQALEAYKKKCQVFLKTCFLIKRGRPNDR